MGAFGFIALRRAKAQEEDLTQVRHFNQGESKYSEIETDTLTLIQMVDVAYLQLKMKVTTIEDNMGPTISATQSAMVHTCDTEHYCLTIMELAKVTSVIIDHSLIADNSQFCKLESKDVAEFFKQFK